MNQKDTDFILATLFIKEAPHHYYNYTDENGIKAVYYTPDLEQLLEHQIFNPIYYWENDIKNLHLTETALYKKVIQNTSIILPAKILNFWTYLDEIRESAYGIREQLLIDSISKYLKALPQKDSIWCLTNTQRIHGALGFYQLPAIKSFCQSLDYSKLLIGIGNRDYAYLMNDTDKNRDQLAYMLVKCPDIMNGNCTIEQPYLFSYHCDTNRLVRITFDNRGTIV